MTASALFDSYLWTQGTSKTISLTGLVANQTYTIAALSQDINPPAFRAATFTANGVSASTVNNSVFEAPFTLGVNYVLINTRSDATGKIDLVYSKNSAVNSVEAGINGFQLTETPEPGSILLGISGLLGLAGMRKFRRSPAATA